MASSGDDATLDAVAAAGSAGDRRCPSHLRSPRTKLVYLFLATVDEADVETMRETLDVDLLNLYPALALLVERDLIEREGRTYGLVRTGD